MPFFFPEEMFGHQRGERGASGYGREAQDKRNRSQTGEVSQHGAVAPDAHPEEEQEREHGGGPRLFGDVEKPGPFPEDVTGQDPGAQCDEHFRHVSFSRLDVAGSITPARRRGKRKCRGNSSTGSSSPCQHASPPHTSARERSAAVRASYPEIASLSQAR